MTQQQLQAPRPCKRPLVQRLWQRVVLMLNQGGQLEVQQKQEELQQQQQVLPTLMHGLQRLTRSCPQLSSTGQQQRHQQLQYQHQHQYKSKT